MSEKETNCPLSCVDCAVTACRYGKDNYPAFCLTRAMSPEEKASVLPLYNDGDINARYAFWSATVEGTYYGEMARVEETMEFARRVDARKIGLAYCSELQAEAKLYARILDINGFETYMIDCKAGAPEPVLDAMFVHNPSPIMLPEVFDAEPVQPGDLLEYGGHRLVCLPSNGHSPGHMSLYDAENEIIFLGDHVLFDITPNIVLWNKKDDALGQYIENLRVVQQLPVKLALPAHRTAGCVPLGERIEQLIQHHMRRTEEILSIIQQETGLTTYQISSRMKWNIVADCWDDFPASQKYFAMCECMAHLQYMCIRGMIRKSPDPEGIDHYFTAC